MERHSPQSCGAVRVMPEGARRRGPSLAGAGAATPIVIGNEGEATEGHDDRSNSPEDKIENHLNAQKQRSESPENSAMIRARTPELPGMRDKRNRDKPHATLALAFMRPQMAISPPAVPASDSAASASWP